MLLFFMLTSALRAAGDSRTPMRLGVTMTILNVVLNVILIRGLGPDSGARHRGLGARHRDRVEHGQRLCAVSVVQAASWSSSSRAHMDWRPDWTIIRSLFRFGLPTGVQGIAMNVAGVMLLRFIGSLEQSAAAQAAYAIGYTELFSLITWTSVGLDGRGRDDCRPEPRRRPSRARDARRARRLAHRPGGGRRRGLHLRGLPGSAVVAVRRHRSGGRRRSASSCFSTWRCQDSSSRSR